MMHEPSECLFGPGCMFEWRKFRFYVIFSNFPILIMTYAMQSMQTMQLFLALNDYYYYALKPSISLFFVEHNIL